MIKRRTCISSQPTPTPLPLPHILASHSNSVYMIARATHPHIRAREGDRYRLELQALAKNLGVEQQILFVNRID
jgi:hypothetical protein